MIIEAQFDPARGEQELTLDVSFGEKTSKITVKRYDPKGYIYRSDPMVPQGIRQKGEVFDPGPPPKGGGR